MWILMYVFSYSINPVATSDRAEWRLVPTVVFQEFSNEERCRAAKSTLEGSLKEAGAKLKSGLEDLKSLGKADPTQIILPLMWNAFRNKLGDHDSCRARRGRQALQSAMSGSRCGGTGRALTSVGHSRSPRV